MIETPEPQPTFVAILDSVRAAVGVDAELAKRLQAVTDYLAAPATENSRFLTVLLRTQGRRAEPLKDAFLCLSAQTDEDFDVVVLLHDAIPEDAEDVRTTISRLPAAFRGRIQLVEVTGGTRAKPLNAGVARATGRYLAVYDDDDLLTANWVEEFRRYSGSERRLLRAVVATQRAAPELWPQDQDGFRTSSWPRPEYPKHFDQLQHMLVNYSPFMSWAFPRALFDTYGLAFDEELHVCEDWDVIMRGSLLLGVNEVPQLTSIYRRWDGGESSYTKHSTVDWQESEQRVIDRLNDGVVLMAPGSFQSMREMVLYNLGLEGHRFLFNGTSLRWPLNRMWEMAAPGVKFAVRARNKVRRMRGKNSTFG
jgi:hypothetical protein